MTRICYWTDAMLHDYYVVVSVCTISLHRISIEVVQDNVCEDSHQLIDT